MICREKRLKKSEMPSSGDPLLGNSKNNKQRFLPFLVIFSTMITMPNGQRGHIHTFATKVVSFVI